MRDRNERYRWSVNSVKAATWPVGLVIVALIALAMGCERGEDRPTVEVIDGGTGSVSVSGTGTVSVSGPVVGTASATGTSDGTGVATDTRDAGGLRIPTGLNAETSGPTKSDGYYTPTTNREIYQKISTDYQEILKLTVWEELPHADIALVLEISVGAVKQRAHHARRNLTREYNRLENKRTKPPAAQEGGRR